VVRYLPGKALYDAEYSHPKDYWQKFSNVHRESKKEQVKREMQNGY
jgi:hypothetical protein